MQPIETINPRALPAVSFDDRYSLPAVRVIYFASGDMGDGDEILYIGQTDNLRKRLTQQHHHGSLFDYLGNVKVAWLEVPNGQIDAIEAGLIARFKPRLNSNHVPVERPKPQPVPKCINAAMSLLTTQEAAERLGISQRRVNELINSGRLPAERFGRAHMIQESDLKLVEDRMPGRPPKEEKPKAKPGRSTKKGASRPRATKNRERA